MSIVIGLAILPFSSKHVTMRILVMNSNLDTCAKGWVIMKKIIGIILVILAIMIIVSIIAGSAMFS
ncbi:hypothetical protein [Pontibacillus yanchengensis]|uniref:hypothetical protein n=1 Tax=Pontibacillus yanchengensis TaxID=462910 RepID=UPI001F25DAFF|nr:hypothetical protein [Pontibacillus yanchengensis]